MSFRRSIALSLAACLAAGMSWPSVAPARDLTVAVNDLPRTLDPGETPGNVDVRVYYNIFDTLIRRDFAHPLEGGGARLVPGLAESWSWSTPTQFDVKLRENASCHDGTPFDADDVLATFSPERLWGADSFYPEGRVYFGMLADVQKLDAHNVRFVTRAPDVALPHRLSSYISFVICDSAWNAARKEGVGHKTWMADAARALRAKPIGTGPYKFVDYIRNDRLRLAAFDGYWEGKPAAETVLFRSVPEVSSRVAALVAGDADIVVDLPPDQWKTIAKYPDLKLAPAALENTHVLTFNMNDPILADKKLRHALSLAIDRKALIEALWDDKTFTPNGHQLASFGPLFIKDRPGYRYDPEAARRLVKESGYRGQELVYRLVPSVYLYGPEAAQSLQEMWRQVGINVRLDFVESSRDQQKPGQQITPWSNTFRIPDPTGSLLVLWGPEADMQKGQKLYKASPEFNELSRLLYTSTDQEERRRTFSRMLDIFEDDMPMTMLYNPAPAYATKNTISWTPYSHYYMDLRPGNLSFTK